MIVTRGLGLGGILVTAGLALNLGIIVVPPEVLPQPPFESVRRKYFVQTDIAVTVKIPKIVAEGLLSDIAAKGSANVGLYINKAVSGFNVFAPSGSAKATVIGVSSSTKLGQLLAEGSHDIEDETILAMLLTLLDS